MYGFINDPVHVTKTIELPVIFSTTPQQVEVMVKFFVVYVDSAYNAILGRPTLMALQAVTYIPHFKLKFPTPNRVEEVNGNLDIV